MKICILEVGIAPSPLSEEYGRYPAMFEAHLNRHDSDFSFESVAVFEGADMPSVTSVDGFLITGSPFGVYEDHPWIAPLEAFIHAAAKAQKPTVGICFGHQIMSRAFGGDVRKSEKGWGVGVHSYDVIDPAKFMVDTPSIVTCAVSHQDQVITPPQGAKVHAGSTFCPNGILTYDQGPAFSMQMHPEFDHPFGKALLEKRKDRIPAEVGVPGVASYASGSDRDVLLRWIVDFYKMHG